MTTSTDEKIGIVIGTTEALQKQVGSLTESVNTLSESVAVMANTQAQMQKTQQESVEMQRKHQANAESISHLLNRSDSAEEKIEALEVAVEKNTGFRRRWQETFRDIRRPLISVVVVALVGLVAGAIVAAV